MKVILLRDVIGVGQKGQVKDVSDGFAMNRLLPQKSAVIATPEKLKELKRGEMARAVAAQAQEQIWREQAKQLKDAKITVKVEANEQGHLYQQLSVTAIRERIHEELGLDVLPDAIHVDKAIKSIGRFDIHIQLGAIKVPFAVFVEKDR